MNKRKVDDYDRFALKESGIGHQVPRTELLFYKRKHPESGMEIVFSIDPCQEHDYISLLDSGTSFRILLRLKRKSEEIKLKTSFDSLRAIKSWLGGGKIRFAIFTILFDDTYSMKGPLHNRFNHFLHRTKEGIFINWSLKECYLALEKIEKLKDKSEYRIHKLEEKYSHHKKKRSGY